MNLWLHDEEALELNRTVSKYKPFSIKHPKFVVIDCRRNIIIVYPGSAPWLYPIGVEWFFPDDDDSVDMRAFAYFKYATLHQLAFFLSLLLFTLTHYTCSLREGSTEGAYRPRSIADLLVSGGASVWNSSYFALSLSLSLVVYEC